MPLMTEPNFKEFDRPVFRDFSPGDDFYEALIDMHRDLDEAQSQAVNARLILLLANHIGDMQVLREAMLHARTEP